MSDDLNPAYEPFGTVESSPKMLAALEGVPFIRVDSRQPVTIRDLDPTVEGEDDE